MTLLTAMEIGGNPYDLEFVIAPRKDGKGMGFFISRGPGHSFKMMFDSGQTENLTKPQIMEYFRGLLEKVLEILGKGQENDGCMTRAVADHILRDLETEKGVASTYKYPQPATT